MDMIALVQEIGVGQDRVTAKADDDGRCSNKPDGSILNISTGPRYQLKLLGLWCAGHGSLLRRGLFLRRVIWRIAAFTNMGVDRLAELLEFQYRLDEIVAEPGLKRSVAFC